MICICVFFEFLDAEKFHEVEEQVAQVEQGSAVVGKKKKKSAKYKSVMNAPEQNRMEELTRGKRGIHQSFSSEIPSISASPSSSSSSNPFLNQAPHSSSCSPHSSSVPTSSSSQDSSNCPSPTSLSKNAPSLEEERLKEDGKLV